MMIWQFMDYVAEDGKNLIASWYSQLDEEVQAEFDQIVLAIRRMRDWSGRWQIKQLTERHAGLWEVRFKIGKGDEQVKYRPLGVVVRDARLFPTGQFVFLSGCHKKLGQYSPPTAFDDALDLKRQFEAGRGILHDHF